MAILVLPFEVESGPTDDIEKLFESGLYKLLSEDMQAACHRNPQLLEYLSMLPIEETGVPEYHAEMNRKLGAIKRRNLVYPVSDQILIHVLSTGEERDYYIPIEPTMGVDVSAIAELLEARMVELAYLFEGAETTEDRHEVLHTILLKLCRVVARPRSTPASREPAANPTRGPFGTLAKGKPARQSGQWGHDGCWPSSHSQRTAILFRVGESRWRARQL